jgi:hypothetical protein
MERKTTPDSMEKEILQSLPLEASDADLGKIKDFEPERENFIPVEVNKKVLKESRSRSSYF